MLRKLKLKYELKRLNEKKSRLVRYLHSCAEISKFGNFTSLGRKQILESKSELVNVDKRIAEINSLL